MWPRPRGRGIQNHNAACFRRLPLQCGHGRAAVESNPLSRPRPALPGASMWPRPRGRGIEFQIGWDNGHTAASMWPRPRGRRIIICSRNGAGGGVASMWPRPRVRGIGSGCTSSCCSVAGLQCGHGRAAVESAAMLIKNDENPKASMWPRPRGRGIDNAHTSSGIYRDCFNVAPAARPWNRRRVHRRRAPRCGFNVATAARPWNRDERRLVAKHALYASMWPRPRGRGIQVVIAATTGEFSLQCGHGRAAVES